VEDKRSGRSRD